MAMITDFLKANIKRQITKWRKEYDETSMVIIPAPERGIDDLGGYGDVNEDTRPDFVKKEFEGWELLVRLDDTRKD